MRKIVLNTVRCLACKALDPSASLDFSLSEVSPVPEEGSCEDTWARVFASENG